MTINDYHFNFATVAQHRAIFDDLIDWDEQEISDTGDEATYRYGGAVISVSKSTNGASIKLTVGDKSHTVSSSGAEYMNYKIIQTQTSVGVMAAESSSGSSQPTSAYNSNQLCFVLTKCLNFSSGNEEKGIVWATYSNVASTRFGRLISSANNVTSSTSAISSFGDFANSAATVLYPACSKLYPGYCPHVFLPAVQTVNSCNGKCTVDDKTYYVMQSSLYLLDD